MATIKLGLPIRNAKGWKSATTQISVFIRLLKHLILNFKYYGRSIEINLGTLWMYLLTTILSNT